MCGKRTNCAIPDFGRWFAILCGLDRGTPAPIKNNLIGAGKPSTGFPVPIMYTKFRFDYFKGNGVLARKRSWQRRQENAAEPLQMGKDNSCKNTRSAGILRCCHQLQDLLQIIQEQNPFGKSERELGGIQECSRTDYHRETFEQVQKLTAKTKRRAPKKNNAVKNMFCDLLYCADCGSKLWFHTD